MPRPQTTTYKQPAHAQPRSCLPDTSRACQYGTAPRARGVKQRIEHRDLSKSPAASGARPACGQPHASQIHTPARPCSDSAISTGCIEYIVSPSVSTIAECRHSRMRHRECRDGRQTSLSYVVHGYPRPSLAPTAPQHRQRRTQAVQRHAGDASSNRRKPIVTRSTYACGIILRRRMFPNTRLYNVTGRPWTQRNRNIPAGEGTRMKSNHCKVSH